MRELYQVRSKVCPLPTWFACLMDLTPNYLFSLVTGIGALCASMALPEQYLISGLRLQLFENESRRAKCEAGECRIQNYEY